MQAKVGLLIGRIAIFTYRFLIELYLSSVVGVKVVHIDINLSLPLTVLDELYC